MKPQLSSLLVAMAFLAPALQLTENQAVALLLLPLGELWPGRDAAHLISAYAVGAAFIPLAITARFPAFGGRSAIASGLLAIAAADLAFLLEPGFGAALGLRAVSGAGSGVVSFALLASLAALPQGRTRAVSAMTAGFLVALVVGIPLSALITRALGVTGFFGCIGAVAAGLGLAAMRIFPPAPRALPVVSLRRDLASFCLRPGPLAFGLGASLLIAAAIGGPVNLFPRHLQTGPAGLELSDVALVYFIAGLGPLVGGVLAPRLVRRFGTLRLAVTGALIVAAPLLLLSWAGASAPRAAAFLALALVIETIRRSALQEHLALLPEPEQRSRYLTLRNLLANLGVALGIQLATRCETAFGFIGAGFAGAALALVSAAATARTDGAREKTVANLKI